MSEICFTPFEDEPSITDLYNRARKIVGNLVLTRGRSRLSVVEPSGRRNFVKPPEGVTGDAISRMVEVQLEGEPDPRVVNLALCKDEIGNVALARWVDTTEAPDPLAPVLVREHELSFYDHQIVQTVSNQSSDGTFTAPVEIDITPGYVESWVTAFESTAAQV